MIFTYTPYFFVIIKNVLLVCNQTHHCPVFGKHLWSYQYPKYSENLQQEILWKEKKQSYTSGALKKSNELLN